MLSRNSGDSNWASFTDKRKTASIATVTVVIFGKIEIPFTTMKHPPCRITDSNTLIDSVVLTGHRDINELIDKYYQDVIQKKQLF